MPWPDESFSCSAYANAFFFIERPERMLSEVSRVLGPRGRLVMSPVPGGLSLPGLLCKRPCNLRTYADEQMQRMLYDAGFETAEVETARGMQVCGAGKP